MKKIGVVGSSGRTGSHVVSALAASDSCVLHAALVSPGSARLGCDVGVRGVRYSADLSVLSQCDAVVDFSTPATTAQVASVCADLEKPLLVGTTALDANARSALERCARTAPVCVAPNTSLSATALQMASTYLRSVLGPSFDVEVMEIHHRMKRDAPSGTALKVVEDLLTPGSTIVTAREGLRRSGEVGVVSLRGGDVAGEHTVFFLGDGERIEVTQRVQSRSVFGAGAVVLVDRLATRSPGLYDVRHLLEVGR